MLKSLAANKNVIVCRPDKGRGVVILNKDTYVNKMTEIISDQSKYEPINASTEKYTRKIEDKVCNFYVKLKVLLN